jgi:CheY-like chemotaxis protein
MTTATGKTLLVVDDDAFVRDMLTLILGNAGHTVVTAANGLHGLDYVRTHPAPDLIILDMMMPDLDGWTFMRVRSQEQKWSAIPVLILTALGDASKEWALSLGACGCLRKPIAPDSLLQRVVGCLA